MKLSFRKSTTRVVLLLITFASLGFAADATIETAQIIVKDWQAGKLSENPLTNLEQFEKDPYGALRKALAFPAAPSNLSVNLNEGLKSDSPEGTVVSFPAVSGPTGGEVKVLISPEGSAKQIQFATSGGLLPEWVFSPGSAFLFFVFSVVFAWLLFSKGALRTAWLEGWALIRQYGKMYLSINILLYGMYILGLLIGAANPELVRFLADFARGYLESIGVTDALKSGIPTLALSIFVWNFAMGLIGTTAIPASLFGIPGLLFNSFLFLMLGVALTPAGLLESGFIFHIPTLIIELQGYILATFGGMVLLLKVLKGEGYAVGFRALNLMVILGAFFLAVGAWYEAIEITLLSK